MGYTCEHEPSNVKKMRLERKIVFKDRRTLKQAVKQACPPAEEKQSEYNTSRRKAETHRERLKEYLEQTRHMIRDAVSIDQINLIIESRSQGRARLEAMVANTDNETVYHMSQLFNTNM